LHGIVLSGWNNDRMGEQAHYGAIRSHVQPAQLADGSHRQVDRIYKFANPKFNPSQTVFRILRNLT
jgi:hypothetical protein